MKHKSDRNRSRINIIHEKYIDAESEYRGNIWNSPSDGYIMVTEGIGPYRVTPEGHPSRFMNRYFEWY